jgi:hypothetical protein
MQAGRVTIGATGDNSRTAKATKVALRPLALPTEHGGWGFVLEPVLLALLVAPSFAGMLIAFGLIAAFMTRHPLKLVAADVLRRRFYPRTRVCILLSAGYGSVAAVLLLSGAWMAGGLVLFSLTVALVPAAVQFWFDARNQSRALVAELSGTISSVLVAAAIVLAGDGTVAVAFAVLVLALSRGAPTIIFVRAALRNGNRLPSLALHLVAIFAGVALMMSGLAPPGAVVALGVLFIRAYATRAGTPAKTIGIRELGYGAMFVLLVGYGW